MASHVGGSPDFLISQHAQELIPSFESLRIRTDPVPPGRGEEAVREGRRAVEMQPVSSNALRGPYDLFLLSKIYVVAGKPDQAIDTLEQLLKIPFYVSARWLAIDPNFAPLR